MAVSRMWEGGGQILRSVEERINRESLKCIERLRMKRKRETRDAETVWNITLRWGPKDGMFVFVLSMMWRSLGDIKKLLCGFIYSELVYGFYYSLFPSFFVDCVVLRCY